MTLNAEERVAVFVLSRVVFVDVDVVQRGLLQAEHIDYGAVQDVVGLGEELIEAPTLLLICLQDVGEDGGQEALKTPETRDHVWIVHQVAPQSSEWSGEVCGRQPVLLKERRRSERKM